MCIRDRDYLGLGADDVTWSYTVTGTNGKQRTLSLDGRIIFEKIPNTEIRTRCEAWMMQIADFLELANPIRQAITGVVFEVRQGYKSKDYKDVYKRQLHHPLRLCGHPRQGAHPGGQGTADGHLQVLLHPPGHRRDRRGHHVAPYLCRYYYTSKVLPPVSNVAPYLSRYHPPPPRRPAQNANQNH